MSCDEYDRLLERADGKCEICGSSQWSCVDHDHSVGPFAVRGILCSRCNAVMRVVDQGGRQVDNAIARYLASAWYVWGDEWKQEALAAEAVARRLLPPIAPLPGATPSRTMRIADEVWDPAVVRAKEDHVTVTDIVVATLRAYAGLPSLEELERRALAAEAEVRRLTEQMEGR